MLRTSLQSKLRQQLSSRFISSNIIVPIVKVDSKGSFVSIEFPNLPSSQSTFHAPWLWSNDPYFIHPTSGQRRGSPLDFYHGQWKLSNASIVETYSMPICSPQPKSSSTLSNKSSPLSSNDFQGHPEKLVSESNGSNTETRLFPLIGSLHPVGGVYEVISDEKKQHYDKLNSTVNTKKKVLRILWESGNLNQTKESYFDLDWLQSCRYDELALQLRHSQTKIAQQNSITATTNLKRFRYDHLCNDARKNYTKFDLLQAIVTDGAAIVTDAISSLSPDGVYDYPLATKLDDDDQSVMYLAPVAYIGKMLGSNLSHGNLYGDIFHVEAKADANNIAYTSEALCPHQDLAYYESPPGLQLLHCVQNCGVVGGQSTLIDCIAAAEEFRVKAPEHFNTLVEVNATFLKQRNGADLCYRRPHIELESSSNFSKHRNGDDSAAVVSVRWSPPFEGPLITSSEFVEPYYVAYAAFQRMVDSSFQDNVRLVPSIPESLEEQLANYAKQNTWEYSLKPGEVLIFNNQRLLHGRRSFRLDNHKENKDSFGRHLIGCYTNIDDTLNEYRLLRRKRISSNSNDSFDTTPFIPIIGNGSSGIK